MKWYVFKDDNKKNCNYEYERYSFSNGQWSFPLYVEEGTKLREIMKTFTDDDMFYLNCYLSHKEYDIPIKTTEDIVYTELDEIVQDIFSQKILKDFIYGFTGQENGIKVLPINKTCSDGDINISINKNKAGYTEVEVFLFSSNNSIASGVLLDNLELVLGEDFRRFNHIVANRLKHSKSPHPHTLIKNSLYELINFWHMDDREVLSISKIIGGNSKSNYFFAIIKDNVDDTVDYFTIKAM